MPVIETRRFRRFSVNAPCLVKSAHAVAESNKTPVLVKTKDVSKGGLCFVANSRWSIGSEIECVIELQIGSFLSEPLKLRCRGRIVRVVVDDQNHIEVGATIEHHSYLVSRRKKEVRETAA
jgi:hypothetical protein